MRTMKKWIAAIAVVAMLITMVACAQNKPSISGETEQPSSNTETPTQPANKNVTITYMASQDWVMDAELELGKTFADETGINIDYQIVPADQYPNLLMTKLNSGECTDLFGSQGGKFDIVTQLNVEKNAVDLSGEEWVSRLDPLARVEVSVNNKVYGQPIQDISAVWAIAYNKKIFADLNLSVPKTFEEFMTVCETIKNAGITPIYECVSDGWHHVLWFPELGPIMEKREPGLADRLNNNETTFAQSPTAKLIIDQIKEMVDKGYWGDNYMDNAYSDAARYFAEGKYAMFVANQGFPVEVNTVDPSFSPEDVGFFVMPLADNQILNINPVCPTRFIYSGSPYIEEAKKYLAHIAKPANLTYLIANVPKYNALPISGGESTYIGSVKEFYDSYPEHGTVYQTAVKYVNPQWLEMGRELVNVILGQNDSLKMLENIDRLRSDQAKAVGDPAWK